MAAEIPLVTTASPEGAAPLALRPADGSHAALLQRIFAESHCVGFELLGLAPAALAGLVDMQSQARRAQYRTDPGAVEYLICRGSGAEVLGSCWLSDSAERLRVLDIAVLAEHRRRGVARAVLTALCGRATAAGKPVRLSVWHDNGPARELYRALGFVAAGAPEEAAAGYLELRYPADQAGTATPAEVAADKAARAGVR